MSRNRTLVAAAIVVLTWTAASTASAAVSCTTCKSGRITVTSCSNTYKAGGYSECRSYRSGRVVKTSCR
jgi:hypothetical protein